MEVNILLFLLLQISIIIILSRSLGLLFRKIGQPLVIGEILAGILLGPSFLGTQAPTLSAWLFPTETVPYLNVLAQIGLIFFMFLVGLYLNNDHLRGRGQVAAVVSLSSIIVPFVLGVVLALFLYEPLSVSSVPFTSFALFMGASMSVTAFPVLARILTQRKLHKTQLGSIAITCAAVGDVTAWCLLAFVVSVVRSGSMLGALPTTILAILYIGFMFTFGRMLLIHLSDWIEARNKGKLSQSVIGLLVVGIFISAMITELIGIHTIFGAFLFGAIVPQNYVFARQLVEKLEDFTMVFLLPIFFVYTGLRTQFNLISSPALWLLCALVILVATVGKFGGSTLAAKLTGLSWREASALGVLMNTRGLMELIILNIGLELGVISPALFAMMLLMALVTTFTASPLLDWIYPRRLFIHAEKASGHQPVRVEPAIGL